MLPSVIGLPSRIGTWPVTKTKSPARTARESDNTRPSITSGAPMTSFRDMLCTPGYVLVKSMGNLALKITTILESR
jgi:hypothetical protein